MLTEKEKRAVERIFAFNCQMAEFFHIRSLPRYSPPQLGCVYAFEMSDGTTKIGVTTKLKERINSVKCAVYLDVLRVHHTGFAPLDFMRIIEKRCHITFIDRKIRGEYFNITFEEAYNELERYANDIATALANADRLFLYGFQYYEELKANYLKNLQPVVPESSPKFARPEIRLADTRVYALLMSDNTVNIVKTDNIRSRAAKAKRDTGLSIKNIHFTPLMSRENARLVEWACQEIFSSRRMQGEFFSVTFEEACRAVDSFTKLVAAEPIISQFEHDEKFLPVIKRIASESANLIADKNQD